MRVYIAAPFELQRLARQVGEFCQHHGFELTSRWLQTADENSETWARRCEIDVRRADALVLINPAAWARSGTGGRHVEFGMARILHKPIVVIGEKTNLFHAYSDLAFVSGDETDFAGSELLAALNSAGLVF